MMSVRVRLFCSKMIQEWLFQHLICTVTTNVIFEPDNVCHKNVISPVTLFILSKKISFYYTLTSYPPPEPRAFSPVQLYPNQKAKMPHLKAKIYKSDHNFFCHVVTGFYFHVFIIFLSLFCRIFVAFWSLFRPVFVAFLVTFLWHFCCFYLVFVAFSSLFCIALLSCFFVPLLLLFRYVFITFFCRVLLTFFVTFLLRFHPRFCRHFDAFFKLLDLGDAKLEKMCSVQVGLKRLNL